MYENRKGVLQKPSLNLKRSSRRRWRGCTYGSRLSLKSLTYLAGMPETDTSLRLSRKLFNTFTGKRANFDAQYFYFTKY
ncbi:unnamed protein product, partial [Vitis vinifera]|uniref:Uncharacterized protein n=1 Tax=Vitis vinifera TaxID=29760 RepID=D7U906_VITVI